jgi:hypothetical protein
MGRRAPLYAVMLVAAMGTLFVARDCLAQGLGHKVLGTLGLNAGVQQQTGLYIVDQFAFYESHKLFDPNGRRIPGSFRVHGVSSAVGLELTYRVPRLATYVSIAFSVPVIWVSASSSQPPVNIDLASLADLYVQPLRLGWRLKRLDLVIGYAFYAPTGRIEAEEGPTALSRAQWTHQINFGGTVYFDRRRSWKLSALGSYDINERKLGIDIIRGETIQVQGGLAKTFGGVLAIGPVGYALYQVRNDRGADVPPASIGARDRTFGVGAEMNLILEKGRALIHCRYVHDLGVASRLEGQLVLLGITVSAWQPRRP